MNISWNFENIVKEIEILKKWRPKTKEEEASKFFALKAYNDLLFAISANDRELRKRTDIRAELDFLDQFLSHKKGLAKDLRKILDEQAQEMLINFMNLTRNHCLRETITNIDSPLVNRYNYQFSPDDIMEMGNAIFNSIPFMSRNSISRAVNEGKVCVTDSNNTIYTANLGKLYPTGHILCTYRDGIFFNSLINVLHESAHNRDLNLVLGQYAKELSIDNLFVEFFPRLIELLSLDYIREKHSYLALDVNHYKYNFLNNQNKYLSRTISATDNPGLQIAKKLTDHPDYLIEMFGGDSTPKLLPANASYDEKAYYDDIISYVERELSESRSTTKLSELIEKINNPILFIPPIIGGMECRYPSVRLADDILGSGKYLLGTLLAVKFYYLIKDDPEKGYALLKEVSEDLVRHYRFSETVLREHGINDYLEPDYIQQYAADYNSETRVMKKVLTKNSEQAALK